MNKILIVDASDSDCRLMSGLLTRAGYEPVITEDMEPAKQEVKTETAVNTINVNTTYPPQGHKSLMVAEPLYCSSTDRRNE